MDKQIKEMPYKIQKIVFITVTVHSIHLISLISQIPKQEKSLLISILHHLSFLDYCSSGIVTVCYNVPGNKQISCGPNTLIRIESTLTAYIPHLVCSSNLQAVPGNLPASCRSHQGKVPIRYLHKFDLFYVIRHQFLEATGTSVMSGMMSLPIGFETFCELSAPDFR